MELRQRARKLNLRKRSWAITSNESVQLRKLRRLITVCCLKAKYDEENSEFHESMAWTACRKYLGLNYMAKVQLPRSVDRKRDFASFDEIDCWTFFKCKKADMPRLLRVLRFPDECILSNRIKMSGEEVFCRGLYELISGKDQHNISRNVFGREQSAQSRAFTYFVDHIYETFLDLFSSNLRWWIENGFVEQSRLAIQRKLEELGINFDGLDPNDIALMVDCNCLQTSRVAGGPRGDGEAADRWDSNIQRAFYNGSKSIHGLKHQTVDLAHGFSLDIFDISLYSRPRSQTVHPL